MNELHFLIHTLSGLAPAYDRRHHHRVVDIIVENWAKEQYITFNYQEKNIQIRPKTQPQTSKH